MIGRLGKGVAVTLLVFVSGLGAGAEVLSWAVGVSYQQVNVDSALMPPGSRSVAREGVYEEWPGQMSLLDWDGDGELRCEFGADGRWRVPELRGTELLVEEVLDWWVAKGSVSEEMAAGDVSAFVGGVVVGRGAEGLRRRLVSLGDGGGGVGYGDLLLAMRPVMLEGWDAAEACVSGGAVTESELPGAPGMRFHVLGTDTLGRDLLVRLGYGVRVSLVVALGAGVVALVIGLFLGLIAGYFGGAFDWMLLRTVEVSQAVPFLVLVILVSMVTRDAFSGVPASEAALPRALLLMSALGGVQWFSLARFVRGQAASLRRAPFVVAARGMGYPWWRILGWHVAPCMVMPVASFMSLLLPALVLEEAFLSFLGLGIQPPYPSLGVLLSDGGGFQEGAPWLLLFPAAVLGSLTLALFVIADGMGGRGRAI